MSETDISVAPFDLGTGVGHSQAFGLIASQCSAAQASSMRQIRDSQIVHISPENYRQIAPKIDAGRIEIAGEMVPLAAQNSQRIRQALAPKRPPREEAAQESRAPTFAEVLAALQQRIGAWFADVEALSRATRDPTGRRMLFKMLVGVQDRAIDAYAELRD